MSFNPLATILNQNKLTGKNYINWKRNLDIVLIAEGHKITLTTVCPQPPPNDTSSEEVAAHKVALERWIKADKMAHCYILASMSSVLQHQHESMKTVYDMILNLKEMFGTQNRASRQDAMMALLRTKMSKGTPMRNHVLKMMGHLNELEVLGAEIDRESHIDIILNSLPESFQQFRVNVCLNDRDFTLTELLTKLQAVEKLISKPEVVNLAQESSTSELKGQKKKKKSKPQDSAQKVVKKSKGKCFRCKQSGHWKHNCSLLSKIKETPESQKAK